MTQYRAVAVIEGEPHLVRRELVGPNAPEAVVAGDGLACFAHLTDLHVTDVQSPARFEFVNREFADPRFHELLPMQRPQEALNAHAIAAMVRALNGIRSAPLTRQAPDLAVMSGDAVDNVQWNELTNFLALLDGGDVRIDSGGQRYEGVQSAGWPDDVFWKPDRATVGDDGFRKAFGFPDRPGLLERAIRPFTSEGLRMPWLSCRGNHEEVCQGVGIVTPKLAAAMVGFHKPLRLPEGIDRDQALETFVRTPEAFMAGPDLPVTPDPDRRPFSLAEFVTAHAGRHGLAADHTRASTDYVHDTPAVRFVVLDTVCRAGGAGGRIDEDQLSWLVRRLEQARERPVVVVSHHTLGTLDNGRRSGGPPYVGRDELLDAVHRAGNVVLWLNGHIHVNAVHSHRDPRRDGRGFWEVTTSSIVDWPCQSRLVEILETSGGLIAIGCTMVDHDGAVDPGDAVDSLQMAGLHRELAGNVPGAGFDSYRGGSPDDRNVILLVRRPKT